MLNSKISLYIVPVVLGLALSGCNVPKLLPVTAYSKVPASFGTVGFDTATNMASTQWRSFFTDKYLQNLIDTALKNNQDLLITMQEIEIAKNEARIRKRAILPSASYKLGAGLEKVGRYTSQGAGDASTQIAPGREFPDPLPDYTIGAYASWEVDIWKKLRNARTAAVQRYLATTEGKNFVMTSLVAEVAENYYELLALDNQLAIVQKNIGIQKNALDIVKLQKEAARATELGVQKFRAEVLRSQTIEFDLLQKVKETENRINLLLARYPQTVARDKSELLAMLPQTVNAGIPLQLLANRPDIKQAELELTAARLDVKAARAEFYPSFGISAGVGLQAFNPSYLTRLPESLLSSLTADLAGPLINRNAIKAEYYMANARQLQALYNYQRVVLTAVLEVSTQLSNIENLKKSYDLRLQQVEALTQSIDIANDLFKSARADYFEVLMTQRDALEAKLELVDTKKEQLNAVVKMYKDLGGGWR